MKKTLNIQAGKFKAECLQLMEEVNKKHITLIITKHGKPIAKLAPLEEEPIDLFGCLKNTITINNDIVQPINAKWEANE
jgi:prevent-host-death family protein